MASLAATPWPSKQIANIQRIELMMTCDDSIDLEYMAKIRKEMPLWDQRRPEVYGKINNHPAN